MEDRKSKYDLIITYTVESSRPSTIDSFPFFWSEWGMDVTTFFLLDQGHVCTIHFISRYRPNIITIDLEFEPHDHTGMPGHHLYSPIRGMLCIGKYYDFRIYVAEARQVNTTT